MQLQSTVPIAILAALLTVSTASGVEPLSLFDFEGSDPGTLQGIAVSTEQAKSGKASAKWSNHPKHPLAISTDLPGDWYRWDTIAFSLYSAKANNAEFMFLIYSDNDKEEGEDYYYREIEVDWQGWRDFEIPLTHLGKARRPAGFANVTSLRFAASGWNNEPQPDTVIYIDSVRLLHQGLQLRNAAFEEDANGDGIPDGWTAKFSPNGTTTVVEMADAGRTGKAVRIRDDDNKQGVGIQQRHPVKPGITYEFSCWKKGGGLGVYLNWHDAEGKRIEPEHRTHADNRNTDAWERFSVKATCPEKAATGVFWLYSYMSATTDVLIDDVAVEETE